jgi:hypothetical protein
VKLAQGGVEACHAHLACHPPQVLDMLMTTEIFATLGKDQQARDP